VEVAVGMVLSDACMYKVSTHALIKFEQGYLQEQFLHHLFEIFKPYCFMDAPGRRIDLTGPRKGLTKSLWFKSFLITHLQLFGTCFTHSVKTKLSKLFQKG